MLQIPFCVLLSQLLIRQKKSHYLYDSCFHQVAICRWGFFLSLKYLPGLRRHWRSLLWFSHFWLAPDWQRETWPGDGTHQSDEVSHPDPTPLEGSGSLEDAELQILSFCLCCNWIWKEVRFKNRMLMLWRAALCDHFSQLNGSWLKTNRLLILFFHWIKCFFCFSCAALLHSHFELTTFCWCMLVLYFPQSWA